MCGKTFWIGNLMTCNVHRVYNTVWKYHENLFIPGAGVESTSPESDFNLVLVDIIYL